MGVSKNLLKTVAASMWMRGVGGRGELKGLLDHTAKLYPEAIPKDVCEKLISIFEEAVSQPNHPRVWQDETGADTRLWCFEREIGELARLFRINDWIKAVDKYTGRKTRVWCLMANRILPVTGNLGSGGGAHRDSPFSNQVKCIWYLSDVGSENGPFRYIPGTNVGLLKQKEKFPLGESRFHNIEEGFSEIKAKAGTLLVCDTKCIHGGKPIESGCRYAITLYTFSNKSGLVNLFRKSKINTAEAG